MMKTLAILAFSAAAGAALAQTFVGPTPYLQASDSPWAGLSFDYFHLEDFEDKALNTPGATMTAGIISTTSFAASLIDSVDGDDGVIDGFGRGESIFLNGVIRIEFDEAVLGTLPTHAGIVWTDGFVGGAFEAFDRNGASLGSISGTHADGVFNGTTAEDRFYGVEFMGGISAITIASATGGGVEADHLQYGAVPEPGIMAAVGLGAAALLRRRRKA
jgi:hypothetical protein